MRRESRWEETRERAQNWAVIDERVWEGQGMLWLSPFILNGRNFED